MPKKIRRQTHSKTASRLKRRYRKKRRLQGSGEKPRLTVFRSNRHIYAQLIDDIHQKVLGQASSVTKGKKIHRGYTQEAAQKVGQMIAKRALDQKIKKVVFDVSGYKYHGRIQKMAEAARSAGLEF